MTNNGGAHSADKRPNGASRARTDDLLAASQTLSQLSYSPKADNGIALGGESDVVAGSAA
jgi:hypothetical protein